MGELNAHLVSADRLLASAVNYLLQGKEHEAATLLLLCKFDVSTGEWPDSWDAFIRWPTGSV